MSQLFQRNISVEAQHIDQLGHVNNLAYMQWMQEIALAHTEHLGLGLNDYLQMKHAMVASEHHVKYRKACVLGDKLILRTWLGELSGFSSVRHYLFYRPQDDAVVFQGTTLWVCVELATGRAKRLSPTFSQTYQPLNADIDPTDFRIEIV
ncbi:acyl-CoA thioesterase [Acinetobacter qingfengensis]|uniref:Thioesterase n=1 Tax=Acinetobacter qingfengensis TaxID=1262585 RepID=A0A1E7RFM5_9GAMM|nr:thioesterase family protein [Acinetobacter qingfengensis]KAA8731840.1 acyl-CoA thioesterase [Acinetobacter qingfengensis]OEY98037.1 thioesterase [Acinetobacter qingfengensis]